MNTMEMENNPISCKLRIPKNPNGTPAFFVNFSNGNLNLNHSDKFKFTCYQQFKVGSSSPKRILIANNGHLNYESASEKINDDRNKFNYFLGVRKKSSGKMKLYNASSFHLKPVLQENNLQRFSSGTKNYRERTDDLDMNFGSKGKKRSTAARQKYTMDSASLGDALNDISLNDSVDNANHSLPSVSSASTNIDYLPPRNNEAATVDQVYKVSDIISTEEDDHLNKNAEELLTDLPNYITEWKTDGTFCDYVTDHLENDQDCVKFKYLLYYNYLVTFSRLVSADIKKRDPAPQVPEPFKSCILDRFTITSVTEYGKVTRSFPLKMKDKLLAYIIVLALVIDDYYINLAQVQKGTKFGLPKITNIAQALGCHVHRNKLDNAVVSTAELKLPLFILQKKKFKKF